MTLVIRNRFLIELVFILSLLLFVGQVWGAEVTMGPKESGAARLQVAQARAARELSQLNAEIRRANERRLETADYHADYQFDVIEPADEVLIAGHQED